MVGNHFEHLQDDPNGKVQDVLCSNAAATKILNRKKWLILGVKLDSLEALLRPVEHLDMEVEIGCRSSGMCD